MGCRTKIRPVPFFAAASLLLPQQAPPPQFRAGVEIARIEVSVLDTERRPVTGLAARDFTILENGRPREIVAFEEVVLPRPDAARVSSVAPARTDLSTNTGSADRRLVVILLDSSIGGLWAAARTRDVARMVVDRLSASDLAAVVHTGDSRAGQDFTTDGRKLLASIERLRPRLSGFNSGEALLGTLSNVVSLLAEAPDRRKLVVLIASGIRYDVSALSTPVAIGSPSGQGQAVRAHDLLLDVFAAARATNVNIYTVDPYGIVVGPGGGDVRKLNRDFLVTVAHNTGAEAVVNTNEFTAGVDRIFEQNASYYLLGFEPSSRSRGNRIEVKVRRPATTVRAQTLLARPEPIDASAGGALDALLPRRDIPLSGLARAEGRCVKNACPAAAVVQVGDDWRATAAASEGVTVLANAYDVEGRRKASARQTYDAAALGGEFRLDFQLAPGLYQVRVAVQSNATGAVGTLYLDLDVKRVRLPVPLE